MTEPTTSSGMQLAGQIFNELVMDEAIKDKTEQVTKQMEDEQNQVNALMNEGQHEEQEQDDDEHDPDFDDDDEVMHTLREQRIAALKAKKQEHVENMIKGHGTYTEITEEEFLPTVTKTKFVVVHFYHKDFERCKIMDHHLWQICQKHTETKFVKIDAEKCPFFVTKLQIQMLPTVICFMDGLAFDRIVGFEELGGKDEFPNLLLARRLVKTGCIKAITKGEKGNMIVKKGRAKGADSDEDY